MEFHAGTMYIQTKRPPNRTTKATSTNLFTKRTTPTLSQAGYLDINPACMKKRPVGLGFEPEMMRVHCDWSKRWISSVQFWIIRSVEGKILRLRSLPASGIGRL